jgi:hypothetical protein
VVSMGPASGYRKGLSMVTAHPREGILLTTDCGWQTARRRPASAAVAGVRARPPCRGRSVRRVAPVDRVASGRVGRPRQPCRERRERHSPGASRRAPGAAPSSGRRARSRGGWAACSCPGR